MIDFQVAYDKLAQFQTADELADYFKSEGLKAIPRRSSECAITKWMAKQTQLKGLRTGTGGIYQDNEEKGIIQLLASHTPVMRAFVAKFDSLKYPDLIDIPEYLPTLEYLEAAGTNYPVLITENTLKFFSQEIQND